jgi:hypothetical protein
MHSYLKVGRIPFLKEFLLVEVAGNAKYELPHSCSHALLRSYLKVDRIPLLQEFLPGNAEEILPRLPNESSHALLPES